MQPHRSAAAKALAAVAAIGLVPFALAFVGTFPAADAPATVQPAAVVGAGSYVPAWVAIQTGATSSITLNTAAGQRGAAQTLAPGPDCGVQQGAPSSRFVTLEGTTRANFSEGLASYQSGSIGVKEKKSGTSCYQVNAVTTEQLRLSLGAGISQLSSTAVASSAYLDLELKQSARILATLSRAGTDVTTTYELQSGSTIGLPKVATTTPSTCNNPADSGPDSGVNDNCRWAISVPSWLGTDDGIFFDTLTLKALNGSFSLEGGGDGTVLPQSPTTTPNASIVEITDGTVDCGGNTRTEQASGDEPQVTVYRLGNVGTTSCTAVPYSLSNGSKFAQFLKPLDTQTSAQFIWDITWRMAPAAAGTALPNVRIDYETPAPSAAAELVLDWCPDAADPSTGAFTGYTASQVAGFPDQDPDDAQGTKQYACVLSRSATSVNGSPDDYLTVHDRVYVFGDAGMRY